MSFEERFRNIAEWIKCGHSISMEDIGASYIFVANDESNMAVALVYKGEAIDEIPGRLDKGIDDYWEYERITDEING